MESSMKPDGGDFKGEMTVRALLDKADVGGLMGRAGANIKKFREDTGSRVDVHQPVDGSRERTVTIKGTYAQCLLAVNWMADNIADRKRQKMPETPHSLTLLVLNAQAGAVIGKGGETIKQIRESSGADIKVSKTLLEGSNEKSIKIEGQQSNFDKAIQLVLQYVATAADHSSRPHLLYVPRPSAPYMAAVPPAYPAAAIYGYGMTPYGGVPALAPALMDETLTVTLNVPENVIGNIIGRGGATIREIRSRSGAKVEVDKRLDGAQTRRVTITGSRSANETAATLISHLTAQMK